MCVRVCVLCVFVCVCVCVVLAWPLVVVIGELRYCCVLFWLLVLLSKGLSFVRQVQP